ncbi:MAG: Cell division protein FtsA [bacterium ADurb.Bin374]|nr:MAG: Cell division protein FtsA [bacterium ADurb.Bin374]
MLADDLIVGLDIGTTKVCAVIGDMHETGSVNVIGVGHAVTGDGVKKGTIVDIEKVTQAIMDAVEEAEKVADVVIERVYVGIAGSHINSLNSQGIVAIKGTSHEITADDVDRAVENAKTAISIPHHQEIIHILPREFVVDEQKEISNPIGMVGSRLEAQVHIVTGAVTAMQNIIKCCQTAKLKVEDVVLQPYASSMSVLTEDEKKLGVVLIDIGGGTTDLIIFQNGHVVHSYSAPVGGQYVTNDIAVGLKTSTAAAESLKIKYGVAHNQFIDSSCRMQVPVAGSDRTRECSQKDLAEIIEPRMEEIFNEMKEQIAKQVSLDMIPAGVVLTGGTSLMMGCPELAEESLGLPVRRGFPISINGLRERVDSPIYATSVGLIRYGAQHFQAEPAEPGVLGGVVDKVRAVFRRFFSD